MVKKIITTALVMLSLSSVANAGALFSADNTLVSENYGCYPDWLKGTQANDNGMAIKNILDGDKENGAWFPLEQSHDNDMAIDHTLSHPENYWQNVKHWKILNNNAQHTKKSKKS